MSDKVIITAALTGGRISQEQTPYIPIKPREIITAAVEAWEAGAAVVHIHARDNTGVQTGDINVYREIYENIKAKTNLVVCLTTSGSDLSEEERLGPIELQPEMVSLDAGTMNFGDSIFPNSPDFLAKLARKCLDYNVKPEIEVFDIGMIYNTIRLLEGGLLEPPLHFQFVLGVKGGLTAEAKWIVHMLEIIPKESTWSVIGVGRGQLAMNMVGLAMGGHVRTGLEDNIYYARGELAKSNAQLVKRVVRLAKEFGRPVASPDEAREMLSLRGRY